MPVFETSAFFILLYAYQKLSGDTKFLADYSDLIKGYADWLAEPRALYPGRQLISVDVIRATANQTGLAVQAAIGLKAAAAITGNSKYSKTAAANVNAIYYGGLGLDGSSPSDSEHFTYNYDQDKTWNVLFASYMDVVLGLDTFPQEAWDMQSDWYLKQLADGGLPFAGPANDLHYTGSPLNWALTDWSKLMIVNHCVRLKANDNLDVLAAAVSSEAVQKAVIDTTHTFMTNGKNTIPFGTKYIVNGSQEGVWIGNTNRASVGCHFGLMALQQGEWYSSLKR